MYFRNSIIVESMATATPAKNKTKEKVAYSKETYLFWFESMMLMRRFEEKAGQLYGMQKIRGFCHLYIGQEACAAGSVSAFHVECVEWCSDHDRFITMCSFHGHACAGILSTTSVPRFSCQGPVVPLQRND